MMARQSMKPGRATAMHHCLLRSGLVSAVLFLASAAVAQPAPPDNKPDATLRSTPETVVWGYFAADIPPALRIKSGQTVRIDTVSHSGINTPEQAVLVFCKAGIPADHVLYDCLDILQKVNLPRGASAHGFIVPI